MHLVNEAGRRRWLAVAVMITAFLASAQPSSADSWVKMGAASATFKSYGEKFRIWDLKCDDRSVYIVYHPRPGKQRELHFNGGCRGTREYDLSFSEGLPIAYRVCVSVRLGRDTCSDVPGPAVWVIDKT